MRETKKISNLRSFIMPVGEDISVILPTLNEKDSILRIIDAIHQCLLGYRHEIIVVDDNSSDGTKEAIINSGYNFVRLFARSHGDGLARAILYGINQAAGDAIVVMDSDFNHYPDDIRKLVDPLGHYDCVLGSRFLKGGKSLSFMRNIFGKIFDAYVKFTTGSRLSDHLFGFFSIKKSILSGISLDDVFYGFGDYYIRLLYVLQKNGVNILQIPCVHGKRLHGKSKSFLLPIFFQYAYETINIRKRYGRLQSCIKK